MLISENIDCCEIGFWFQLFSLKKNVLKAVWYYWDGKQNSGLLTTLRSKNNNNPEAVVLPFALNKALKSSGIELDSKMTLPYTSIAQSLNNECLCSHDMLRIFS